MLIRIFSPTECRLIRDADLKKCGLNRMTTVLVTLARATMFVVCMSSKKWELVCYNISLKVANWLPELMGIHALETITRPNGHRLKYYTLVWA